LSEDKLNLIVGIVRARLIAPMTLHHFTQRIRDIERFDFTRE